MNFFDIGERTVKGIVEIYPKFRVVRSSDLMIKGGKFYAVWDEEKEVWSTDEYDVPRLIDADLQKYYEANKHRYENGGKILYVSDFSSKSYLEYRKFVNSIADNGHALDSHLIFANTKVKRSDYSSKHLDYALEPGDYSAYDELVGTLYSEKEREKFEWAIGSIIAGESKKIQKFIVFYGEGGTGKSTVLNIIQNLFKGYCSTFDAKSLGMSSSQFATEAFKSNPLVAIQHDGDLSRIDDNTKLNQIISHEEILINEKNKSLYPMKIIAMLFMGTNTPVKITNSKSGIIRRLIDVYPTGNKIPFKHYTELVQRTEFELPGIATHCLEVYRKLGGMSAYGDYQPRGMIYETNFFYNFVEDNYFEFKKSDGVSLKAAYDMYKAFCDYNGSKRTMLRNEFYAELKNYFKKFQDVARVDGKQVRSWYSGFRTDKFDFEQNEPKTDSKPESWLKLEKTVSLFDEEYKDIPAQKCRIKDGKEIPAFSWAKCKTKLKDILTTEHHYCKPPDNMIVIDFDLKDEDGNKNAERNIEAASKWPPTYAEFSKGGSGIHLHYIYTGDPLKLQAMYDEDTEIKIFKPRDENSVGGSLRRRLSFCNDIPVATISSGLPLKGVTKMINFETIKNEKMLRARIAKALRKEYAPHHTVTSIDYIFNDLESCFESGMKYDVRDMRPDVMAFANNSTNNGSYCVAKVGQMKFCSEEETQNTDDGYSDDDLIGYDIEVYPNMTLVCWKKFEDRNKVMDMLRNKKSYDEIFNDGRKVVKMFNPTADQIKELVKHKLVGFNCRRYDNHILWAIMSDYTNEQIYAISRRIIDKSPNAFFKEAYNLSYTDVYDFAATKQSLKKWEIELGIHHQEMGLPWDQPVDQKYWDKVGEYCANDVLATEAVFWHLQKDFEARQMLADIAKLLTGYGTVNDTTNQLTTKIILRGDRYANKQFVYPDLKKIFPGYEFCPTGFPEEKYTEVFDKKGKRLIHKSYYKGCDPSEGGRVYSKPGMYGRTKTYDVASMHPSSSIAENGFGKYTKNFKDLLDIRLAIKRKEYDKIKDYFDGTLVKYTKDKDGAKALSYALKIAINSVYGLTSAKFDNPMRDPRNIDNWVAKRGALFMIDLQQEVDALGYKVIHVKTDSIKVHEPTPEVEEYIIKKGKEYGYTFEIEAVYDRICLVNKSTYIAKYASDHPDPEEAGKWTATGDQFKVPYVFKTLFSKERITFDDLCETKSVETALYLDMNEHLPDVRIHEHEKSEIEKLLKMDISDEDAFRNSVTRYLKRHNYSRWLNDIPNQAVNEIIDGLETTKRYCEAEIHKGHDYHFIGKVGRFCPMMPGTGGGELVRDNGEGGYAYAEGSSGYRWMESEMVKSLHLESKIDRSYYDRLADEARHDISMFGDFEAFTSDNEFTIPTDDNDPPWDE